jgi:hypothetical protein
MPKAIYNLTEVESKDLLELDILKGVENLQEYHAKTKAQREKR